MLASLLISLISCFLILSGNDQRTYSKYSFSKNQLFLFKMELILFNSVNLAIGIRLGAAVFMINKYQLIRLDYNSIE